MKTWPTVSDPYLLVFHVQDAFQRVISTGILVMAVLLKADVHSRSLHQSGVFSFKVETAQKVLTSAACAFYRSRSAGWKMRRCFWKWQRRWTTTSSPMQLNWNKSWTRKLTFSLSWEVKSFVRSPDLKPLLDTLPLYVNQLSDPGLMSEWVAWSLLRESYRKS